MFIFLLYFKPEHQIFLQEIWEEKKKKNHHEPRKKLIISDILTAWFWMFIPNILSDLQNWLLWTHKPTMLNTPHHDLAILGNILAISYKPFSQDVLYYVSLHEAILIGAVMRKFGAPRGAFSIILVCNVFKTFGFLGSFMSYFSSLWICTYSVTGWKSCLFLINTFTGDKYVVIYLWKFLKNLFQGQAWVR